MATQVWTQRPPLLTLFFAWVRAQSLPMAQLGVAARALLTTAGLASLVIAAFLAGLIWGFMVLGFALLILEWAVKR